MKNLDEIPFLPGDFHRVGEALFAAAMENVLQVVDGVDEEQAMRIVDAVLGPLLLVPPPPRSPDDASCGHRYYHERDGWLFCTKDHDAPDDDPDAHSHRGVYWDSDMPEWNIRAFAPAKEDWR